MELVIHKKNAVIWAAWPGAPVQMVMEFVVLVSINLGFLVLVTFLNNNQHLDSTFILWRHNVGQQFVFSPINFKS